MRKILAGLLCGAMLLTSALAAGPYTLKVDGTTLDLSATAPYEEGGHVMLPLRPVAEALGFSVTWDQATRAAALDNGTVKSAVSIGTDSYYLSGSQTAGTGTPQSFGAAPALVKGTTYVPSELFTLLCGHASVKDGTVSLWKEAPVQLPNPMHQYKDLAEASAALGFAAATPSALPEGYALATVWVIGGTLLDLRYEGAAGAVQFRMGKGTEDVSGDFTKYASTVRQPDGRVEYTLKGDGATVSLVLWTAGDYTYSLSFAPGVTADAAVAAAKSVKP